MADVNPMVQTITLLLSLFGIAVALITAATSARTSVVNELKERYKEVKTELLEAKNQIERMGKTLEKYRKRIGQYEDYIHATIQHMQAHHLEPLDMKEYVFEEDDTISDM